MQAVRIIEQITADKEQRRVVPAYATFLEVYELYEGSMAQMIRELDLAISEELITEGSTINDKYYRRMTQKDIIVCDIDGTISVVGERLKYLHQTPVDWDTFYNDCFEDEPITEMCALVEAMFQQGYKIIFLTGRRASVECKTRDWINKHLPKLNGCYTLLMRNNGDHRHDVEVKPEKLQQSLTQGAFERIAFILEDRNSMVAKWREMGLRCLQVAEGEF